MPRFDPDSYIDVQDRITRFWTEYPDGRIETDILSDPNTFEQAVFIARVYKHRDHDRPDATGIASEWKSNGPQATSWHEVGETSAIGRALANMGYAKDAKDRPSRQEMAKVERGAQPAPQRATRPQDAPNASQPAPDASAPAPANLDRERVMKRLHAVGAEHGIDHDDLHARAVWDGYTTLADVPVPRLVEWGRHIKDNAHGFREQVAQIKAQQAELLPGTDAVPDPDRFTR